MVLGGILGEEAVSVNFAAYDALDLTDEQKEELDKKAKDDSWKDAWKPGDPLPEGATPPTQERRFPFRM